MKMFKRFNTILFKLTASYVLITVLCVMLTGIFANIAFQYYFNKQIESSNEVILSDLKEFIDKDILEKADAIYLTTLSDSYNIRDYMDEVETLDRPEDYKKIKEVMGLLSEQLVLNSDWLMNLYTYSEKSDTIIGPNGLLTSANAAQPQKPEWFDQMIQTKLSGFSYLPTVSLESIFYSGKQDGCILVRRYPKKAGGSNESSYLFFEVNESAFQQILAQSSGTEAGATILIADEKGNVISSTQDQSYPLSIADEDYFKKVISTGEADGYIQEKIGGTRNIVSYTTIHKYGWKVLSIMPRNRFYRASSMLRLGVVLLCLLAILLGIGVSNFFTRSIYNPIRAIVKKVGRGGERPSGGGDEYAIINRAISTMIGEISSLKDTLDTNRPLIKNNLVQALIYRKIHSQEELNEFLSVAGKTFEGQFFVTSILKLDTDIVENLTMENSSYMTYNMIGEMEKMSDGGTTYIAAESGRDSIVVVGAYKNCSREQLMQEMQYIEDYFLSNFYISCVAIVGDVVRHPLDLYRSYDSAAAALKYRFLMPRLSVVYAEDIRLRETANAALPDGYLTEFNRCIRCGDQSGCQREIHDIVMKLVNGEYKASYCNTKMLEMVSAVSLYLREQNLKSADILNRDLTEIFASIDDIYEFETWLGRVIESIFAYKEDQTDDTATTIVQKSKEYIAQHLADDLSLNIVAEHVYISTQYLSKVFKEKTGMNFSEYITNTRMEAAAELLLRTTQNIESIAGEVGYKTPHYFIKKFKEKYGMTPKAYRMRHTEE